MPYGKTVFEMLNEVYTGGPSRPPPAPGRVNESDFIAVVTKL